MNELALFAGAGGGILGGQLLGWRTICAVERDAYAAQVLAQRQNDGTFKTFPIWSDVTTFDGGPWAGRIDVISGGFPCQDVSVAGKGAGLEGERSGLWGEMRRIVSEIRPYYVFIENSPALTIRGLERVICDLAALGYDAKWGVLGAADVGANHQRDRIWILATDTNQVFSRQRSCEQPKGKEYSCCGKTELANSNIEQRGLLRGSEKKIEVIGSCEIMANTRCQGLSKPEQKKLRRTWRQQEGRTASQCSWWTVEPKLGRVANGVAYRVNRLKAIGNGQVPAVAAEAFIRLSGLSFESVMECKPE